ncbi:DM13 domain-containing protein [Candidatus Woesearchaeota archaeon]|nr:DM13 domain-containing protein [Candidatus Woesearchaeota archaeon]
MKKTIIICILAILLLGCAAQVDDTSKEAKEQTTKEQTKETTQVKETTVEPKQTPVEETETAAQEPLEITEAKTTLDVGETKTVTVAGREYKIKLLSISNRAQFVVNGEVTKDLIINGVDTLKDQAEIKLLQILYNSAEVKITAPPEKEELDISSLKGKGTQHIATGIFQTVEKTTAGHVEITLTAEGDIVMQLQSFVTQPGAGLYIYLVDQNIEDGYEVAKLTTITGGQTYNLPGDVDVGKYKKVVIYSKSEEKVYGEAMIS